MAARKQTLILISIALMLIGAIFVYVACTSPRVYDEPNLDAQTTVVESTESEEHIYPVNLNTASADEFVMISGIGSVKAQNIISYREKHGGFGSVEELKEVDGIGDKLYEQISGSFTV